jgi:hypothetical protein
MTRPDSLDGISLLTLTLMAIGLAVALGVGG